MSSITTDQGIVHYEGYGRGHPVILLHGWLGSWGLFQETMEVLGQSYRTYAPDFWGFGESGRKRSTHQVQNFVSLVDQFMHKLGIFGAVLVGHSMGGTVRLSVMGMFGDRDNIVNPNQWKALQSGMPTALIERFPIASHFIMLDDRQNFMVKVKDFLASSPVNE